MRGELSGTGTQAQKGIELSGEQIGAKLDSAVSLSLFPAVRPVECKGQVDVLLTILSSTAQRSRPANFRAKPRPSSPKLNRLWPATKSRPSRSGSKQNTMRRSSLSLCKRTRRQQCLATKRTPRPSGSRLARMPRSSLTRHERRRARSWPRQSMRSTRRSTRAQSLQRAASGTGLAANRCSVVKTCSTRAISRLDPFLMSKDVSSTDIQ